MKKLIYCALAFAAGLFAASCQQENLEPVAGGNTVTYTVEVPGIDTKAIGDALNVNELIYEVWRTGSQNDTELKSSEPGAAEPRTEFLYRKTVDVVSRVAKFEVDLVKDQNYTILFWAQVKDGGYYNTSDLKNVTLTNKALTAFDEQRAAFYGTDFIVAGQQKAQKTVTLTRPFGQINLGTVERDAQAMGYTLGVTATSVTVKGASTAFNVATGVASDEDCANLTFASNAPFMPEGKVETLNGTYEWIAMNYIFVPANQATLGVDYTITTNHGNISNTISNLPTQKNYRTNIVGNLLTSKTDYIVELDKNWAGADITHAMDASALQAALDNAVPGTTIQLEPGVNYGTLYLRPSANVDVTKEVDWVGNNYRYETYSLFENITIKGAEGATVDAIEIEGGTYYNTEHSQADKYPIMLSLIELKNVVIEGVTFTGKGGYDPQGHGNAINLSGNNIKVDGLTIQNCTLNNPENNARLIYKTESTTTEHKYTYDEQTKALQEYTFTPSLKNITVTGTTFNGGYIGLELRETENVTITNNTFNVADRNILLPVNSGCTYSGKVTITGNVSNNAKQRFVRMSGAGDAEVVIKNNTINNYQGADADYIKVTDGTNVTIENNVLGASTAAALQHLCNLATGTTNITLTDDIEGDVMIVEKEGVAININGDGKRYDGTIKIHNNSTYNSGSVTIETVNFNTAKVNYDSNGKPYFYFVQLDNFSNEARYSQNVTVNDCTFTTANPDVEFYGVGVLAKSSNNLIVNACSATGVHSLMQASSCGATVSVIDCKVKGSKSGVSFGNTKEAIIEETTIEATGYGVRADGTTEREVSLTVTGCNINSYIPVVVRKLNADNVKKFTINVDESNTLTKRGEYHIALGSNEYEEGVEPVKPASEIGLNVADGFIVYDGSPVAKVGDTEYDNINKAIAAWTNNSTLTLLANVTLSDAIKISSTEMHTLDLGTYTLTGAKGKNAIEIINNGRASASYALDIKADSDNPGGITASRAVVKTTGKSGVQDRPIIRFYNGVFNANNIISHSGSNETNCPQFQFHGGVYNGTISANRALIQFYGGTFNGKLFISVDSSAYALISGGRFKELKNNYGSSLNSSKLTIGSSKGVFDRGVYVDDDGYIVVEGPVITEFGDKFEAKTTNIDAYGTGTYGSYLPYSSVPEYGLYYTNAEMAISKHGAANVVLPTPAPKSNEIWYTSDEMKLEPTTSSALNANIVSNVWDSNTGEGVITFDAPLTIVGMNAFQRITNTTPSNWMTSITLPNGVTSIGDWAFYQNFSLVNVTIPKTVLSIGDYAFGSCGALKTIICKSTTPPTISSSSFNYLEPQDITVIVPAVAVDVYKADSSWQNFNIVAE